MSRRGDERGEKTRRKMFTFYLDGFDVLKMELKWGVLILSDICRKRRQKLLELMVEIWMNFGGGWVIYM